MTSNEALLEIEEWFMPYVENSKEMFGDDFKGKTIFGLKGEVLIKAVEALEKQVPKKPHRNYAKLNAWWCVCGEYLGKRDFVAGVPNFCPNCGQAIDWSEVE